MRRQILITLLIGLSIIALIGSVKYLLVRRAMAANAYVPQPETVTAADAERETWQQTIDAVGSLSPVQGVTLSVEVAGTVEKIHFKSGSLVQKGTLLVSFDTSVERAELAAAEAQVVRVRQALARARTLREKNANSVADLELAEADFKAQQAQVESWKARIAKKNIIAPFTGRTGIRTVNVGDFVAVGTLIVPLHALDKLYVNFSVPQQAVANVSVGQKVDFSTDTLRDSVFVGNVTTVNPNIDPVTRNVDVQAIVSNPQEKLRSGMFGKVRLSLEQTDNVVVIPASSINYAPFGNSVYVIEQLKDPAGNQYLGARQQIVHLGAPRGDQIAIVSGLQGGEKVVSSGLFKMRPNVAVNITTMVQPSNDPNPEPTDS